jgi:lysophospholipase L1-like esterase
VEPSWAEEDGMATIVCFGDSNTQGMDPRTQRRLPPAVRWPGVLGAELGEEFEVIEEGLNGRTTAWDDVASPFRNGRDYLLPCLWSHAPVDLVIVMLGTNDTKARLGLSAPDIASGASLLVDLARQSLAGPEETPPRILLVCPPPLGPTTDHAELWGFGESRELSARLARFYRLVAADAGVAFLDAGEHASLATQDGVHLDADGHRRLGLAVAASVRELLGG